MDPVSLVSGLLAARMGEIQLAVAATRGFYDYRGDKPMPTR